MESQSYQMHDESLIKQGIAEEFQALVVRYMLPGEGLRRMDEGRP
jgi:hypothetical protein